MTKFVIEATVFVPTWIKQLRHYYVDEQLLVKLLAELEPEQNTVVASTDELRDLLTTTGEISTLVALNGKHAEVMKLLDALAKGAWKNNGLWDIDETEISHIGKEKFSECVRAYVVSEADYNICIEGM